MLAIDNIPLLSPDACPILVSDSLTVLMLLQSPLLTDTSQQLALNCKQSINRLTSLHPHPQLMFIWCPAHMGVKGNEIANTLAIEHTDSALFSPPTLSSDVPSHSPIQSLLCSYHLANLPDKAHVPISAAWCHVLSLQIALYTSDVIFTIFRGKTFQGD